MPSVAQRCPGGRPDAQTLRRPDTQAPPLSGQTQAKEPPANHQAQPLRVQWSLFPESRFEKCENWIQIGSLDIRHFPRDPSNRQGRNPFSFQNADLLVLFLVSQSNCWLMMPLHQRSCHHLTHLQTVRQTAGQAG